MKKFSNQKRTISLLAFTTLGLLTATIAHALSKPTPPGRPNVIEVRNDSCDLEFDKPKSDGGSPIVSYFCESREHDADTWVKHGTYRRPKATILNLQEGDMYQFRAIASNEIGDSEPSKPTDLITITDPF